MVVGAEAAGTVAGALCGPWTVSLEATWPWCRGLVGPGWRSQAGPLKVESEEELGWQPEVWRLEAQALVESLSQLQGFPGHH